MHRAYRSYDDLRDESNNHQHNDREHYAFGLVARLLRFLSDSGTARTAQTPQSEAHAAEDHSQ